MSEKEVCDIKPNNIVSITAAKSSHRAISYYRQELKAPLSNFYRAIHWSNIAEKTKEGKCSHCEEKAEVIVYSEVIHIEDHQENKLTIQEAAQKEPEIKEELINFINKQREKLRNHYCKKHLTVLSLLG